VAEVVYTDEFGEWFDGLSDEDAERVAFTVDILADRGVALGHPHSSAIRGARYPIRELRVQAKGHALRAFYAFDPKRQAVLLIGGDKTGDDRFYEVFVPKAESIWEQYLAEQDAGAHGE
jgi:hypothetical protein